ncbi:hypothetical protein ANCCAN_21074 [Ancylostoma caninum]|uniref:Reverse transcriptase RNase H-like domain-containing protein n=1 Tax=Ancylostoma caninum TaxID=29170 RepID=A0A368FM29_ANCCA|nr:hypothetical protein ANCCAN_21074 [Ancylostoma caninum]
MLHPVYFASRALTKAEENYHVTDLEALAVIFALREFHHFVHGLHTIVRTDHQPLTCLFKRTNISARILRWALEIQKYKLEIEYVAGKANAVADALSRSAVAVEELHSNQEQDMVIATAKSVEGEWLKRLKSDPDYKRLVQDVEERNEMKEVKLPRSNHKYRVADFTIEDGELKLIQEDTAVKFVPKIERRAGHSRPRW